MTSIHKKLKVSVGIPAYNEEANIARLIRQILVQKADCYTLSEVVVVSDGSSDDTESEVRAITDLRVKLLADGLRLGKVERHNRLCKLLTGDVFVFFDADVVLADKNVLESLIREFISDPAVGLVCGKHRPLPPHGFIEQIGYFGAIYWETAKDLVGSRGDMYNCLGQIRAFSKGLAKKMVVPTEAGSFEDTYSFLYAKRHGYKVVVSKRAKVLFRLSTTLRDYLHQMTRYIRVARTAHDFFSAEEIALYNHMSFQVRLEAFWLTLSRLGVGLAAMYIILQCLTVLYGLIIRPKAMWSVSPSSKII